MLSTSVLLVSAYSTPSLTQRSCISSARVAAVQLSINPFSWCPLFGDSSSSKSAPSPSPKSASPSTPKRDAGPIETLVEVADGVERALQSSFGVEKPLACSGAELAVEAALRLVCEELATCDVSVESTSSARLLRGELGLARVRATGLVAAGLRLSSLNLEASEVSINPGNAFSVPPQLPNLQVPANLRFGVRISQDDANRSPILFNSLQELLRELMRTGVSSAIGAMLPNDISSLQFKLVGVESMAGGKIVLVADADGMQSDGTSIQLRGMRVRTTPRASAGQRLVLLDRPELLSSFEGFGAKLEVGLPFLRAAGIALPDEVSIERILVEDGAMQVDGTIRLKPIDYDDLASAARRLQNELDELRSGSTQPVTVDVESSSSVSGDNITEPLDDEDNTMRRLRKAE